MVSIDSWWDGLVRNRSEAVLDIVLNVIADDYECVEYIRNSIKILAEDPDFKLAPSLKNAQPSRREVISALRELTREGYAQAFILGTQKPYAHSVAFRESDVDDLWFYITAKGKNAIERLSQRDSEKA